MTTNPPPIPPPLPPPHSSQNGEQTALRILELKNQMKSLEAAVILAIFVPVFGCFYASKKAGYGMLASSLLACFIFLGNGRAGFPLFIFITAHTISVFSALKQAKLYNEAIIQEAKRPPSFV